MQKDAVAIADHEPGGHLSEAICRAGNEDMRLSSQILI